MDQFGRREVVVPLALRLDVPATQAALATLVERHAVPRSRVTVMGGEPMGFINAPARALWPNWANTRTGARCRGTRPVRAAGTALQEFPHFTYLTDIPHP